MIRSYIVTFTNRPSFGGDGLTLAINAQMKVKKRLHGPGLCVCGMLLGAVSEGDLCQWNTLRKRNPHGDPVSVPFSLIAIWQMHTCSVFFWSITCDIVYVILQTQDASNVPFKSNVQSVAV